MWVSPFCVTDHRTTVNPGTLVPESLNRSSRESRCLMSVESPEALERSVLESKDREQLLAIASALGVKANSRTKKGDIIDRILDQVRGESPAQGGGSNGNGHPDEAATSVLDEVVNELAGAVDAAEAGTEPEPEPDARRKPVRRRDGRAGRRGRGRAVASGPDRRAARRVGAGLPRRRRPPRSPDSARRPGRRRARRPPTVGPRRGRATDKPRSARTARAAVADAGGATVTATAPTAPRGSTGLRPRSGPTSPRRSASPSRWPASSTSATRATASSASTATCRAATTSTCR